MLPTPAKFHYVFNLRDLSRIWQGMCIAIAEVISTPADLIRLWRNEFDRVIADRFVNEDDILWFHRNLKRVTTEHLQDIQDLEEIVSEDRIFVDFMRWDLNCQWRTLESNVNDAMKNISGYRLTPRFNFSGSTLLLIVTQRN